MFKPWTRALLCAMTMLPTGLASPVFAQQAPRPWQGKATQITRVTYNGRAAFRLTDGRSEAIVVPSLGRVMRYGLIGGENWLWNAPAVPPNYGGWLNYGGDKTWPAPQSQWGRLGSKQNGWPPPIAWDGAPHEFELRADASSGSALRTTSPIAPGSGARITRDYRFENGEFVISQTSEKLSGSPSEFGIWSIAQAVFVDAVYVPLNPASPYKNNWLWHSAPLPEAKIRNISPTLLEIRPALYKKKRAIKMGADSPVAAIVAVKNGMAWKLATPLPEGKYPDALEGAGMPVEIYVNDDPNAPYVELELLGPLRKSFVGSRWQHTVRWSLVPLAHKNIDDSALHAEVEALLHASP